MTTLILAAALAAGSVRAATAPDPRLGGALVDPETIAKAARLRVSDQGRTVVLAHRPDGSWCDESYFSLPADFYPFDHFLRDGRNVDVQAYAGR